MSRVQYTVLQSETLFLIPRQRPARNAPECLFSFTSSVLMVNQAHLVQDHLCLIGMLHEIKASGSTVPSGEPENNVSDATWKYLAHIKRV